MGTFFLISSGLSSLFLIILFIVEERRRVRFGEEVRAVFDRMLTRMNRSVRTVFPVVNEQFGQELFYFVVHKVLSGALSILRKLERLVLRIVRFNRMQVVHLRARVASRSQSIMETPMPTEHARRLAEIMEHKRSVELTPSERTKRKEASIEGSGPF